MQKSFWAKDYFVATADRFLEAKDATVGLAYFLPGSNSGNAASMYIYYIIITECLPWKMPRIKLIKKAKCT